MSNDPIQNTTTQVPQVINTKKSVFGFFLPLLSTKLFTILFGVFVGLGIGIKFNPEPISLKMQIYKLQQENAKLKEDLNKSLVFIYNSKAEIKESVKLP